MSKSTKPRIFEGILENKILVMHHEKNLDKTSAQTTTKPCVVCADEPNKIRL